MTGWRRPPVLLGLLSAGAVLAGCASSGQAARSSGGVTGSLTVLAAASLQHVLPSEAKAFQAEHPGVRLTFSFAGSQVLVAEVNQGAPADVLATADTRTMAQVHGALDPQVFAHNQLVIVVPAGNPRHLTGLADLARPGLAVALAAPAVPAGAYARKVLTAAHVPLRPATSTENVTAVVTDVRLGQADAGIVYATDIAGIAGVSGVSIPARENLVSSYPVTVLAHAANAPAARAFVAFLRSAAGQRLLVQAGFAPR